jgi:hypothetical protein
MSSVLSIWFANSSVKSTERARAAIVQVMLEFTACPSKAVDRHQQAHSDNSWLGVPVVTVWIPMMVMGNSDLIVMDVSDT